MDDTAGPDVTEPQQTRPGWLRRHRTPLIGGAVALLLTAAVALSWVGLDLRGDGQTDSSRIPMPPATAVVTRMTLIETVKVGGTLGYGDPTTVTGRTSGTITWLPAEGAVVERGGTVYRRDELPVPLLYGTVPMYRTLGSGAEGSDVRELEENLAALGYDGFTLDDSFSSGTADAVRSFQEDRGLPETGRLRPDEVVIAPAAIRVTTLTATLGGTAVGPVLAYTETTRAVSIALDVAKQHLVTVGVTAEIELPDGSTVEGEVSHVGTVATTVATVGASASGPTIEVTVAVADQTALGTLDAAPVTVTLQADRAQDVLTVPVAALLALSEGGYGVQIVEGDTTRYVAVNLGMFANGRVEISGDAIAEGVVVGMPS